MQFPMNVEVCIPTLLTLDVLQTFRNARYIATLLVAREKFSKSIVPGLAHIGMRVSCLLNTVESKEKFLTYFRGCRVR